VIGQRGEKILPQISKLLSTVFLLLTSSAASASPTTYQNTIAAPNLNHASLNPRLACSASKAEQFIRFSPAFIFERIPRGPPHLT
jgi:hypothetical protein